MRLSGPLFYRLPSAMAPMIRYALLLGSLCVGATGCGEGTETERASSTATPPTEPIADSTGTDYVIRLGQLEHIDAAPGESISLMRGGPFGFDRLSLILTETQPGAGPPVHVHESEEAHVLQEGRMAYIIGDSTFTVEAPYIARVPAGVPHAFVNEGERTLRLVAIFPTNDYTFEFVRPNPLATFRPH